MRIVVLRDFLLNQLKFADRLIKGVSLTRVGNSKIDAALSLSDATRRNREAAGIERRTKNRKSTEFVAQQSLVWNEAIFEVHFGEVVALERAHWKITDPDTVARFGSARIDQKSRHSLVPTLAVERCHHEEQPRVLSV